MSIRPEHAAPELLIVATGTLRDGMQAQARALLAEMQGTALQEPGCLRYEARIDADQLVMIERWANAAAFEQHTGTVTFARLVPALKALMAEGILHADIVSVQDRQAIVI